MKRIDVPLGNLRELVSACICLHNLCIIHNDGFNIHWASKTHTKLQQSSNQSLGNLENAQHDAPELIIAKESLKQMKIILLPPQTATKSTLLQYDGNDLGSLQVNKLEESIELRKEKEKKIQKMLKQATIQHEFMAQNNWQLHLAKESDIVLTKLMKMIPNLNRT